MHFGKRMKLEAASNPSLAAYYIGYKHLKQILKKAAASAAQDSNDQGSQDDDQFEEVFELNLESEVAKVCSRTTYSHSNTCKKGFSRFIFYPLL